MDVVCTGQARLEGSINVNSVAGRQGAQSSVSPDMALQEILTSNQDFSRANFVCARLLYTPPSQNICIFRLLHIKFDHSSYSKNL
jgi:hypothetical protein